MESAYIHGDTVHTGRHQCLIGDHSECCKESKQVMGSPTEADKKKAAKIVLDVRCGPVHKANGVGPVAIEILQDRIASVLADERERSAMIAESKYDSRWDAGYVNAGLSIAAAIRQSSTQPEDDRKTTTEESPSPAFQPVCTCSAGPSQEHSAYCPREGMDCDPETLS